MDDVISEVKKLKQQPGKSIQVVGGARLAATLVNAGLIDEYRFVLNPILLSKGKSLFQLITNYSKLQLQYTKTLKSGVVILQYNPA